jgi:hypothetical protein
MYFMSFVTPSEHVRRLAVPEAALTRYVFLVEEIASDGNVSDF